MPSTPPPLVWTKSAFFRGLSLLFGANRWSPVELKTTWEAAMVAATTTMRGGGPFLMPADTKYQCYYRHQSRDSVSPVCGIFFFPSLFFYGEGPKKIEGGVIFFLLLLFFCNPSGIVKIMTEFSLCSSNCIF